MTTTSFVAGTHDRFVLIDADEHHGIQLDLSPVAAHQLLGRPLHELSGDIVPLEAILGRDATRLVDDLATTPSWQQRFRRLDHALAARLSTAPTLAGELQHTWSRIATSGGQVRIAALADEVGWSPRRLRHRFTHAFGLAPKRMARLTRFAHAAALLARADGPSLAEIAVRTGYYDQAHLTNAVAEHSGLTPAGLRQGHLPDQGGVFETDRT